MRSFQLRADDHHVDEGGNLISCVYVDFRDPLERTPIATLQKGSSRRHAIPGSTTIRLSKPACFLSFGEGVFELGLDGRDRSNAGAGESAIGGARAGTVSEVHYSKNGWIYCASVEPGTAAQGDAWRRAMPCSYKAISPIRRPRQFARALGAMVAEQVGPRGPTVVLRSTVEGLVSSTVLRSQTVYHGPVAYSDDPYRRLERASSDLELLLLLLFMKHSANRDQREYRFALWTESEPAEECVDLWVSPALLDAMCRERPNPEGSGFLPVGVGGSSMREAVSRAGAARMSLHDEATLVDADVKAAMASVLGAPDHLLGEASGKTSAISAINKLRVAVGAVGADRRQAAATAAWHAEPIVHYFCATLGGKISRVRVSEDSFIVIAGELARDKLVKASIAVGPEGTCACRLRNGDLQVAAAVPDPHLFEQALAEQLEELGIHGQEGAWN